MPYYQECPVCGSALDPGERCYDCTKKEAALLTQKQPQTKFNNIILPSEREKVKDGETDEASK